MRPLSDDSVAPAADAGADPATTSPPPRTVSASYADPLDAIWLGTLSRLGWALRRTDDVFASWDGEGTLSLATPATLDPDDHLAQLILHEVCHAVVAVASGRRDAFERVDWGLENADARDLVEEHACHRLQAAWADRHGLRAFMAPTTDWRPYYDALPADALAGPLEGARSAHDDARAVATAKRAWREAARWSGWPAVDAALAATRALADVVAPFTDGVADASLWRATGRPARR